MKRTTTLLTAAFFCLLSLTESQAQTIQSNKNMEELNLTQQWDKTFPQSDKVNHSKVTFHNRYGITLAADLYIPKNAEGKLPAIAVSGPFGAVKEQASGLYAQALLTLHSPAKAEDNRATWLRLTSIRKISARPWIIFRHARMWTLNASESSASAVSEASP